MTISGQIQLSAVSGRVLGLPWAKWTLAKQKCHFSNSRNFLGKVWPLRPLCLQALPQQVPGAPSPVLLLTSPPLGTPTCPRLVRAHLREAPPGLHPVPTALLSRAPCALPGDAQSQRGLAASARLRQERFSPGPTVPASALVGPAELSSVSPEGNPTEPASGVTAAWCWRAGPGREGGIRKAVTRGAKGRWGHRDIRWRTQVGTEGSSQDGNNLNLPSDGGMRGQLMIQGRTE